MQESVTILLIGIISFLYGLFIGHFSTKEKLKQTAFNAENIVKCFKDVDWGVYHFACNGVMHKTKDGQDSFYKVRSIDEAIEKLNRLMKDGKNKIV